MTIRSPISGHVIKKYQVEGEYVEEGARLYDVADLSTVWIEAQVYEDELAFLHDAVAKKLPVTATTKAFPNREFKGKLAFIHPHLDASTRTLKVRFDMDNPHHDLRPGMYATVTLKVPATRLNPLPTDAGEKQKRSYEQGLVLAVPERAVIDTGSRKIVYREAEPDVYEGVEVRLGPRCGDFYPVVRGLKAGDRVATTGSFLIDAETRLTAGASSTYFGASGGPQGEEQRSGDHGRAAVDDPRRGGQGAGRASQARPRGPPAGRGPGILPDPESQPTRLDGRAGQGHAQGPAGVPLLQVPAWTRPWPTRRRRWPSVAELKGRPKTGPPQAKPSAAETQRSAKRRGQGEGQPGEAQRRGPPPGGSPGVLPDPAGQPARRDGRAGQGR